ncbi:hypothetical protein [Streptomyces sp. NPDC097619]|uniref:hypothetical protein n=1 Tax=Streptomyces sp. NPDC097619 TaxID=3157228 RepID=UPI003329F9C5
MAGATPFRKRPFRKQRETAEEYEGGATGPETGLGAPSVPSATPEPGSGPDGLPEPRQQPAAGRLSAVREGGARAARTARAVTDGVRKGGGGAAKAARAVGQGVRKSGDGAKAALGYLADRLIEVAPRIPVRDLATLRAHFPGLDADRIAEKLIAGAANASSTVGAGIGAAAMLPVPPAMPTELAAEITGVAAIELKLIAELHEVYGHRPPGNLRQRSTAYLMAWTEERGIDVTKPTTLNAALGGQMKRELRQQITKRMVRNLPNLMPFMIGAAVGAVMNRRDTRKLADKIRADLRATAVPWDRLAELPPLEQHPHPLEQHPGSGTPRALEGPQGPGPDA